MYSKPPSNHHNAYKAGLHKTGCDIINPKYIIQNKSQHKALSMVLDLQSIKPDKKKI